jgi:hypothetical protein
MYIYICNRILGSRGDEMVGALTAQRVALESAEIRERESCALITRLQDLVIQAQQRVREGHRGVD